MDKRLSVKITIIGLLAFVISIYSIFNDSITGMLAAVFLMLVVISLLLEVLIKCLTVPTVPPAKQSGLL